MGVVLVTGMSGTGKSSALRALAARGRRVVDTDDPGWSRWVPLPGGGRDRRWDEARIGALLDAHAAGPPGPLVLSGCVSNQGRFRHRFDALVLLSAPAEVILARVAARGGDGADGAERAEILQNLAEVEPLLRAACTVEVDATLPLAEVVDRIDAVLTAGG